MNQETLIINNKFKIIPLKNVKLLREPNDEFYSRNTGVLIISMTGLHLINAVPTQSKQTALLEDLLAILF